MARVYSIHVAILAQGSLRAPKAPLQLQRWAGSFACSHGGLHRAVVTHYLVDYDHIARVVTSGDFAH